MKKLSDGDARELEAALRKVVAGEVRFDAGSRALYSTDSSNYRQVPIGVVVPAGASDILEALAVCRRFGAPILARGGGTSLAGQCCNVAVVFDLSKSFHRVLEIDPERKIARVEPGAVLDILRDAAERHGLTFGPDPATHSHCTLGGMIGNNSCGVHSVMAGKTDDNVVALDIVTYDGTRLTVGATSPEELARAISEGGRRGEIYSRLKALAEKYAPAIREKYPDIPRCVSGYNLPFLLPEKGFDVAKALVGSESTCVLVLEATLKLVWSPPHRTLLVLGYPDIYAAADDVPEILAHRPIGLEGMDDRIVSHMKRIGLYSGDRRLLPDGAGWLMVEFGAATREESEGMARGLAEALKRRRIAPSMKVSDAPAELWRLRGSALGATAHVPGEPLTWEGWEDSAVAPERLGPYLRDFRRLLEKHSYTGDFYGHFGQGCVHTRTNFDLASAPGIEKFRAFLEEAADLVIAYGGSLSGEHGDGQSRAELLPKMFGPELMEAFREFKAIWDPDGRMNPGKVVNAYRVDENLRQAGAHRTKPITTHFRFSEDGGDFSRAVLRCVGVGDCRRLDGGTMCPSFMVTREEEHSTRGRARLLFEMLRGETIREGWRDPHTREALDLCLACKGCKGDCPVNVDMATYKAEFLSHYYEGRLRPVTAYTMGLIHRWARLASLAPGLANFFTQTPGISRAIKAAGGIAARRRLPAFARQSFRKWFSASASASASAKATADRGTVLLWPDTFNNYFHPETARAAVEVLEAAGFRVTIPPAGLCCGRPLYDYGMLDLAGRLLREILGTLRREIREGIPVVVLEPSCAAVFRDELPGLFPDDEDARRLASQTFLLSEFLEKKAGDWKPPALARKAIVQGHCHHNAILKMADERKLLEKLGLDFEILDSGCCGMAGSFGFEKKHYDISLAIGERVLLPAVRRAAPDTLVIADGFSCREQISQAGGREALHLAEVLRMAIERGSGGGLG